MNTSLAKKIITLTLVLGFVSIPGISFAQQQTQNPPRAIIVDQNQTFQQVQLQNSQANPQQGNSGGFDASGASDSVSRCVGTGAIANVVKGEVQKLLKGTTDVTRVPTGNAIIEGKETGAFLGVSWDQLGWCAVNGIIEAIGAATVNWINSGFQGNPVFVEDPAQFFADVADIQAGAFLNELSSGFLCSPIQNVVRVNLAQNYNSNVSPYNTRNQCTFSGSVENMERFMSGNSFSWAEWNSYTQNPQNNPFGATLSGQIELDRRIAQSLGIESQLLEWSGGILSSRDPETGKITSPGTVIEQQINERLGSGQRRLEMADEFDEVVNALVNQLIKVAISEMTQ